MSEEIAPTEAGWYAYSGGGQTMVFYLGDDGQWFVHTDNGMCSKCDWGYIEQALSVWHLINISNLINGLQELGVSYNG